MTEASSVLDVAQAQQFFQALYGGADDGWLVMSSRGSGFAVVKQWFTPGQDFEEAAQTAVAGAMAGDDVYYSCALMQAAVSRGRGRESDALLVPGVWAEVDYGSSGHSSADLLSEGDALDVIRGLVTKPSLIIRSGGGFHLYWLLQEPLRVDSPEGAAAARQANRGARRMLELAGIPQVDLVADLARVLRPPGTKNWKLGPEQPREVSIVAAPGHRYGWNELSPYLLSLGGPEAPRARETGVWEGPAEPARLEGIVDGCAWLRHCRDDATSLPEPEWHGLATILALVADGREVMHEWSRPHPGYTAAETDAKFAAALTANAPVRCQTVRDRAGDGWCARCEFRGTISSPIQLGRREVWVDKERREERPAVEWRERELTDDGNALRFVDLYGERVRYVPRWKSWLIWDGLRWAVDTRNLDGHLSRETVRSIREEAELVGDHELAKAIGKWAMSSQGAARIGAVTTLARSDPEVVIAASELDSHPWLLNVQNGTLDLRTGSLRGADRSDLITQCANVTWDEDATCPLWDRFLLDVTNYDPEMVGFLKRIAGYTLTGSVREQVFFFLYGTGRNGKGTFIHTLRLVLSDYARTAEAGLLMESRGDAHPTGLADLFAKRMVIASESKNGRKLDEEVVKRLTGDDEISARRLYENFFEFEPTHKLWLMANSKPIINDATFAMWRRLILIPFEVQIPAYDVDPDLRDKLLANESSGILRWAVEGCLEWQREGLVMPRKVVDATASYQASEDLVGRFLAERMRVEPGATVATKDLMAAYGGWCYETSAYQLPTRQFRETLEQRGFVETTRVAKVDGSGLGRGYKGLRLLMPSDVI